MDYEDLHVNRKRIHHARANSRPDHFSFFIMKFDSFAFEAVQNPFVIFLQKIIDRVLVAFFKSLRFDSEGFPVAALIIC